LIRLSNESKVVTKLPPLHPGEVLRDEFLTPSGFTEADFAQNCGVALVELSQLLEQNISITVAIAMRLSTALGTTPQFWMNLQSRYDSEAAARLRD
jgi:addiction module HigA family antidote